ncbi:hypothetical protein ACFOYW_18445 [Gryllotalpicola reticulitermitis]|uniref:Uncharacterized protein n=1 Tax=Gryllotalpicola reticulitermitis TaxID=1184153 RepID=A0ABV8QCC1_9MICO
MSIVRATDNVTVWLDDSGVPARLLWEGTRWRVTDAPTPLDDILLAGIAHPPHVNGWPFQGTNDEGESRVFDVKVATRQECVLMGVYD